MRPPLPGRAEAQALAHLGSDADAATAAADEAIAAEQKLERAYSRGLRARGVCVVKLS